MAQPILMPKAGQSMTEGTIVSWFKQEGEAVHQGEPLLEIETDKANLDVEAPASGVLRKVFHRDGDVVPVLAVIGVLGSADEAIDFEALAAGGAAGGAAAGAAPRADVRVESPRSPPPLAAASSPQPAPERLKVSPRARQLAAERDAGLATVRGSGPGGRILRRDLETAAARPAAAARDRTDGRGALAAAPSLVSAGEYPPPSPRPPAQVPFAGMRAAIARALQASKSSIPHFYTTMAIDVTEALALKASLARSDAPVKVTINDLVLRACALALADEPRVNCRVFDDRIQYPQEVNLGVAVGTDDGLVVPVILSAEQYDLAGLAAASRKVIEDARRGKLSGTGRGTFTVSNLGVWGIESFTAIINPPEGAILAVGGVREEIVPAGGGFFPRSLLRVTLSCDHRAIDGLLAARFLARLKHLLESVRLR
jgi:pyruvate dehydrogenase E2 component (dihydrolipoamide acetyltransferase)